MSLGSNNKVSTSTQVGLEYSSDEARSIIGQEDTAVDYVTKNLSHMSLRKQSKGIRPPLVGQASSSSNDSVSQSSCETNNVVQDRPMSSPTPIIDNAIKNITNDSVDNRRTFHLHNRNDYNINQKSLEGSYILIGASFHPIEGSHDLTRVRSSSSASSVTSSRPLEWDNGADVGYNQSYCISGKLLDPNMSTVERMALVSSTELLRRSDPEGTTGGTTQQVVKGSNQTKIKVKNKFSYPDAHSTPIGSCEADNASSGSVDFMSPIPCKKREDSELEVNSSESKSGKKELVKTIKEGYYTKNPITFFRGEETTKHKIPLFPEIDSGSCMQKDVGRVIKGDSDEDGLDEQYIGRKQKPDSCALNNDNQTQQLNNNLESELGSVGSINIIHKKLSSSLENISNLINYVPSYGKSVPATLPRSHSQSALHLEKSSNENIANKAYNIAKGNIAIQNFVKNISASSSSVGTVVHRKGDSPKHAQVQTSVFNRQSVGTQVSESINLDRPLSRIKSTVLTGTVLNETPNLPKAVLKQQLIKRSNYFIFSDDPSKESNDGIDQPLVETSNESCAGENLESRPNTFETHFHNGITCKGAHRKSFASENPSQCNNHNSSNSRKCRPTIIGLNSNVPISNNSNNQQKNAVCSSVLNSRTSCGVLIDSIESSAKSGGCGTDKQYSVTVEDRVNSFEYLPGHVYENNERQQNMNSSGTSSMSIENQTSNNGTPEDQNKMWESSGGSMSSTFEKDAQRGVDILSDFVKGAYENDTLLKKKLIRRIADKLISKNQMDRKMKSYRDLMKNTPWVPPRPSNPVERNNVKTHKSKVPCELSSHSEKSATTNTSSECFIPRPATNSNCFPHFNRDGSCQKDQGELSSTSNVTLEKSKKDCGRHTKLFRLVNNKAQNIRKNDVPVMDTKQSGDSKVEKVVRSSNWKEPVTKTEKLIEEGRRNQNDSSTSHSNVSQLLDMERENQLFWIRSKIEHLSNLKLLLERQEKLKRGLKNCKSRSRSADRGVLKDKNRVERDTTQAATSAHTDMMNKKSSMKTRSNNSPKLSDWLQNSVGVMKTRDIELEGWTSHHYENDENISSCMKKTSKHQTPKRKSRTLPEVKNYALYDKPPISLQRRKPDLKHQKGLSTTTSESTFTDDKDYNKQILTDRVGPKRGMREREHKCQCLCEGKCQCCANSARSVNKDKEPVGYYIIFDDPKKIDKSKLEKHRSEEVGFALPMGEQKQKSAPQHRAREYNASQKEKTGLEKKDNDGNSSDLLNCETGPNNSGSETDRKNIHPQSNKSLFKGGAGELQYHLLHNRPSYVSRAEDRRQCIAQMQYLRELSSQNKRRLLSLTKPDPPPPPSIKVRRVFSQNQMRQMTEKKYRQLSEVREKLQDTKKKERYRTNRLMAEIFKKNLQRRVLKGEVNLSNSVFVISSV